MATIATTTGSACPIRRRIPTQRPGCPGPTCYGSAAAALWMAAVLVSGGVNGGFGSVWGFGVPPPAGRCPPPTVPVVSSPSPRLCRGAGTAIFHRRKHPAPSPPPPPPPLLLEPPSPGPGEERLDDNGVEEDDGDCRRDYVDDAAYPLGDDPQRDVGGGTGRRSVGGRWIAVVDDDEATRSLATRFLESSSPSYRVTPYDCAETFLNLLRSPLGGGGSTVMPDAVVVDVALPRTSGLDLLRELRSDPVLARIPVVLLTARSRLSDRLAGYSAGADVYLPKPYDPRELEAVVKSLLARAERAGRGAGGGRDSDALVREMQRDLREIRRLLAEGGVTGGNSSSSGYAEGTGVFVAPDERRVLERLCRGCTNKEIAADLFLSTRRVEQLLTGLFRKTQTRNRTELVRWAVSTGQVDLYE